MMQNFREKYAYKVSLYSIILSSFVILSNLSLVYFFASIFALSVILRFISTANSKHWKDIIFLLFVILIYFLFSFGISSYGPIKWAPAPRPGIACLDEKPCSQTYSTDYDKDDGYLFSPSSDDRHHYKDQNQESWTFVSMFDSRSLNYIGTEISFFIVLLISISLYFSVYYLFGLRKRENIITG